MIEFQDDFVATQDIGGAALFRVTYVSEETARKAAAEAEPAPVTSFDARKWFGDREQPKSGGSTFWDEPMSGRGTPWEAYFRSVADGIETGVMAVCPPSGPSNRYEIQDVCRTLLDAADEGVSDIAAAERVVATLPRWLSTDMSVGLLSLERVAPPPPHDTRWARRLAQYANNTDPGRAEPIRNALRWGVRSLHEAMLVLIAQGAPPTTCGNLVGRVLFDEEPVDGGETDGDSGATGGVATRCPTCGSPDSARDRRVLLNYAGDAQQCPDPWHSAAADTA